MDEHELPPVNLVHISTQWSRIGDTNLFVLRYATAIKRYLQTLLRDSNAVEDVLQSFLLKVVEHGFKQATPDKGRFRNYLIRSVHNAAVTHLRKNNRRRTQAMELIDEGSLSVPSEVEKAWNREWYDCLTGRVWRRLQHHEDHSNSHFYTVLQVSQQNPELDSKTLAREVSQQVGREISPENFRKQLSRARRMFATILIEEVSETLDESSPEAIRSELTEVGLMPFVEEFLP